MPSDSDNKTGASPPPLNKSVSSPGLGSGLGSGSGHDGYNVVNPISIQGMSSASQLNPTAFSSFDTAFVDHGAQGGAQNTAQLGSSRSLSLGAQPRDNSTIQSPSQSISQSHSIEPQHESRSRSNAVGEESNPHMAHKLSRPAQWLVNRLSKRHDISEKNQGRARSNAVGEEANPHSDHQLSRPGRWLVNHLLKRHGAGEDEPPGDAEHKNQGRERSNAVGEEANPHLGHKLSRVGSWLVNWMDKRHPEQDNSRHRADQLGQGESNKQTSLFEERMEQAKQRRQSHRFTDSSVSSNPFSALFDRFTEHQSRRESFDGSLIELEDSENPIYNRLRGTSHFAPRLSAFLASMISSRTQKDLQSPKDEPAEHRPRAKTSFGDMPLGFEVHSRQQEEDVRRRVFNEQLNDSLHNSTHFVGRQKQAVRSRSDTELTDDLDLSDITPGFLQQQQPAMHFSAKIDRSQSFIDFSGSQGQTSKGFNVAERGDNPFVLTMNKPRQSLMGQRGRAVTF